VPIDERTHAATIDRTDADAPVDAGSFIHFDDKLAGLSRLGL